MRDALLRTIKLRPINVEKALLLCFVTFIAVLLTSCSQPAVPSKAVDIAKADTCTRCKKPITDIQFAAEFITKDGFVRKFDDIGCMLEHARKLTPAKIAAFFTMDYDKKQWMKAEDAA